MIIRRLTHAAVVLGAMHASIAANAALCDSIGGCTGNELLCAGGAGVSAASTPLNRFGTGDFTLELEFLAQFAGAELGMIGKGDTIGSGVFITIDASARVALDVRTRARYGARVVSPPGFANAAWHHLAVIRRAAEIDLFIDGSLVGSALLPAGSDLANDADLLIGAAVGEHGSVGFAGRLDEVRLWNAALDPDTIACRQYDRLGGNEVGLVAYYPFDDSLQRRSACDRSPYGNDGGLGSGTQITRPTRSIPPAVSFLNDTISVPSLAPCDTSGSAEVDLVATHACGATVRAARITGADAPYFHLAPISPTRVNHGDTLRIRLTASLGVSARGAMLAVELNGCDDPAPVALRAEPQRQGIPAADRAAIAFSAHPPGARILDSVRVRNAGSARDTFDLSIGAGAFALRSAPVVALAPADSATVVVEFHPPTTSIFSDSLIVRARSCGAAARILLIGVGDTSVAFVVCGAAITVAAGDTADLVLSLVHAVPLSAADTMLLVARYDARAIGIVGATTVCGTLSLVDRPDTAGRAMLTIVGCAGPHPGPLVTVRIVARATSPSTAPFTVEASSTNPAIFPASCTSMVTIGPEAGADTVPAVCAAAITITAGDSADVALSLTAPEPTPPPASIVLRVRYDARQLGILGAGTVCGVVAIQEQIGDTSVETIQIVGCVAQPAGPLASLRVVALAPDSANALVTIDASTSLTSSLKSTCSSVITILPRCDISRAIYSPARFSLSESAPNPLEESGEVAFALGSKTAVVIALFDPFGRRVAKLVDATLGPGSHSVRIDAAELHLRPGTYYYMIDAGTFHGARRMIVVR